MTRLKTVFMGTPDFAVPCLAALAEVSDIITVVTQPDRPRGRGQKLQPSPVKAFALQQGFEVWQPEKIKQAEAVQVLRDLNPDLIVVVAFGQILSKEILSIPPLGCVNVHASLLPQYRGAAPIHWSIINGETKSGVTTMLMDEGLDTGDMLLKKEVDISQVMTMGELHDCLMEAGASILKETVMALAAKSLVGTPQDNEKSTYAPLLKKSTEKIDWSKSAQEIHNLIRGLNPWPGAYTLLDDKVVKIWLTQISGTQSIGQPGEISEKTAQGFLVATGDGMLEVLELQLAGKRKMAARDVICGNSIKIHDCFV